ncbi:MAG: hypothetical protein PHU07_02190 [Acidocella sp.]|nr:hypothetical protein [Acidocella sp.]
MKKLGFELCEYSITVRDAPNKPPRALSVTGWVKGGLGVRKLSDGFWVIDHLSSGYAVYAGLATRASAVAAAEILLEGDTDWSTDRLEAEKNAANNTAIKQLRAYLRQQSMLSSPTPKSIH